MMLKLLTVYFLFLHSAQETGQQRSGRQEEKGGGGGGWARDLCECFSWALTRSLLFRYSLLVPFFVFFCAGSL